MKKVNVSQKAKEKPSSKKELKREGAVSRKPKPSATEKIAQGASKKSPKTSEYLAKRGEEKKRRPTERKPIEAVKKEKPKKREVNKNPKTERTNRMRQESPMTIVEMASNFNPAMAQMGNRFPGGLPMTPGQMMGRPMMPNRQLPM